MLHSYYVNLMLSKDLGSSNFYISKLYIWYQGRIMALAKTLTTSYDLIHPQESHIKLKEIISRNILCVSCFMCTLSCQDGGMILKETQCSELACSISFRCLHIDLMNNDNKINWIHALQNDKICPLTH